MSEVSHTSLEDKRGHHFFIVDDAFIDQGIMARIGPVATTVYLVLCRRADKDRTCFPAIADIVKDAGISERSVYNAMATLEQEGLVGKTAKKRPNGSRSTTTYTLHQVQSDTCTYALHQMHPPPAPNAPPEVDTVEVEETTEVVSQDISPKPGKAIAYPADFLHFWSQYPRTNGTKAKAFTAWKTLRPDQETQDAILAGLARWNACEHWRDGYVVHAQRFLNERMWEDEPAPPRAKKSNGYSNGNMSVADAFAELDAILEAEHHA